MPDIVGIRFKRAGKVYYFDPAGVPWEPGAQVVVETARGLEIGWVVIAPNQVLDSQLEETLKPVLRRATPEDLKQKEEFRLQESRALETCTQKITQHNLPMKLLSAEYNLDGSRITFYFTAEGRVDFRELVRDLAATFRMRVELRQVGPRDETKLLGGLARCGRPLCCANHLASFGTISIKMAKEQELPLNPQKISGACGRLLCCLGYENDFYIDAKTRFPKSCQQVSTPLGAAKVLGINVIKETVFVQLESRATTELPLSDLTWDK